MTDKHQEAPKAEVNRVAGSFQYGAQLPNGKSLSFSGYVIEGDTLEDINMKLDVAAQAIERQRLKAEVPELEAKLAEYQKRLEQTEDAIKDILGKDKPSSQDKQTLNTLNMNKKVLEKEVEVGLLAIQKAKKVA